MPVIETDREGEKIARRTPSASLATIDASHLSIIGQPERYAELVVGFPT